ncbi:conserved hypothetical protein [Enhydrobacter sp. AX1]|nr:hypothetical protein [Enhydrobacter sp. AX1]VXA91455.1 conserved hypothetical protein [Enhydrobacter sp. AX1]
MNSNNPNSQPPVSQIIKDFQHVYNSFKKNVLDENAKQSLETLVEINQKSIEQFVNSQSHQIDSFIIKTQNSENLVYIAGHAFLKVVSETEMQIFFDLYFQDKFEQWVNKKVHTQKFFMKDELNDTAFTQLTSVKEFKFDIEPPKE